MNLFIIPANSKSGKLIFSLFTPFDLILLCSGVVVSILSMLLFSPSSIQGFIIALLPGIICIALVIPIPNYHNVLCVLISVYNFYTCRRNYYWKGWCFYEQIDEKRK
jgi:hypothetical protein